MKKIDGVDYTPEGIQSVRKAITELRDKYLDAGEWHLAVVLSHNLVLLNYLIELTNRQEN